MSANQPELLETLYGVTSLPGDAADAPTLLYGMRNHWGIENRVFPVRDVTTEEAEGNQGGRPKGRARTGSALTVRSTLRNAALIHSKDDP